MSDNILVEQREYHSTTHYINKEIPKDEIISEFGDLETFKKGLLDYQHEDYDAELSDKVTDFLNEFDYDRHIDEWAGIQNLMYIDYPKMLDILGDL